MGIENGTNEAALVCSARRGDKEALCTLFERNWSWLRGLVCSIAGGTDVDDILQNTCVQVIRKIGTLRELERFEAWLAVIARNEALKWRRKKRSMPKHLDEELLEQQPDESTGGGYESVLENEQAEQINRAVEKLSDKYREVFVLAHTGDLTYARIAEILDIPITTVQIRLVRARRMVYDLVVTRKIDKVPRT